MGQKEQVEIDELGVKLTEILNEEAEAIEKDLYETIEAHSKMLAQSLRGKSPKKTGEYAAGWRVRTEWRYGEQVKVIYNAKKPWLTYILEYGTEHQGAQQHIRPAVAEATDGLAAELEAKL